MDTAQSANCVIDNNCKTSAVESSECTAATRYKNLMVILMKCNKQANVDMGHKSTIHTRNMQLMF